MRAREFITVAENIEIPIGRGRANTSVPDILYHSLRGRALNMSGGIDAYVPGNPQEWRELGSRFKQPIQGLVYLSNKPLDQSALTIDVHKLDPNLLRYTGQSEGYLIYGDNIPADAIIDVSGQELDEDDKPAMIIKIRGPDPKVKAWIQKVYSMFPQQSGNNHVMPIDGEGDEQEFALFELVPSFSKRDAVEIKWIASYPKRQGVGSKAMKILQDLAQQDGITLTTYPWDKGVISQAKLTKFYKKQGFAPLSKGASSLIWKPK